LGQLLEMFPLPAGVQMSPVNELPPPRVLLHPASQATLDEQQDPLNVDVEYYEGIVKVNERMTTEDWYQDVRHLEIDFQDDIQ